MLSETNDHFRAVDYEIAARVMGWRRRDTFLDKAETIPRVRWVRPHGAECTAPYFSTDIAAAWQVVEHITRPAMATRGVSTRFAYWWAGANLWADTAASAALAICRAALTAVGESE